MFGKEKMATFERYFVANEKVHEESKNAYYKVIDRPEVARKILKECQDIVKVNQEITPQNQRYMLH